MLKNLIWDLDGTLFDTYPAFTRAFMETLSDAALVVDENWVAGLAKISLGYCIQILTEKYHLDAGWFDTRFQEHYQGIPFRDQPPFPGVRDLCVSLVEMGGTNTIVTHRSTDSAVGFLREYELAPYFLEIISPQDGLARKPDPAMFLEILRRCRFNPDETLTIGDREIDLLAGATAGVRTCFFGSPDQGVQADYYVDRIGDVVGILQSTGLNISVI